MSEATTDEPRQWSPAIPLRDVIAGRALVALPVWLLLSLLTGVADWCADLGMGVTSVLGLSLIAVAARETLDVAGMRIFMRIRRTNTYKGRAATALTLLCPPIAGLAAGMVVHPGSMGPAVLALLVALTYLPWILFARPWDRRLTHEELQRRRRPPQISEQDLFRTGVKNGIFTPIDLPDAH